MGKLAEQRGWRKVAAAAMVIGAAGVALTLTQSLVLVIIGLGLVILAAFTSQTAAALGQGTSTETDKGLASAIYFSMYYAAGSIAGYVPGLAWERFGWGGVASAALGSYALGLAAAIGGALLMRRIGTGRASISLPLERIESEEST